MLENSELIKCCMSGDMNSFGNLYKLYSKNALGTAYLISDHKAIAEDIVQEAFIQCYIQIKNLKNPETFEVWFYKILVRTGWKMVKNHKYFIPMDDEIVDGLSTITNMNSELDNSEFRITVNDALEKLTLPLKTVIILHYYNDMSIKEISEVLGCFQGTVKSRLHNARKQLFYELHGVFNENDLIEPIQTLFKKKELKIDGKHI